MILMINSSFFIKIWGGHAGRFLQVCWVILCLIAIYTGWPRFTWKISVKTEG